MGIDVSQFVSVGYQITSKQLEEKFSQTTPAEFRLEDRFDPKTGKKTKPKKIITKYEQTTYFFGGKQFSEARDLVREMEKTLKCSVDSYGDYMSGDDEYFIFGFHGTGSCDARRCPEDGEIDLESVINDQPKYKELERNLRSLGVDPGKLRIFNCYSVS